MARSKRQKPVKRAAAAKKYVKNVDQAFAKAIGAGRGQAEMARQAASQ